VVRTLRATRACATWLAECLRLGWSRDQLDALEAIWWQFHDDQGNLIPAPKDGVGGTDGR
jgi:hypothetical protein